MLNRRVILLRGVTPNGKSKIPNMTYLAQILEEAGFKKVKTYLQTGNIILETSLSDKDSADLVHKVIYEKLGADICPTVKSLDDLKTAVLENPFKEGYDKNYIKLFFTNDAIDKVFLTQLLEEDTENSFSIGKSCLYIYNPPREGKKQLNNSYFERRLRILGTSRKLAVIEKLSSM